MVLLQQSAETAGKWVFRVVRIIKKKKEMTYRQGKGNLFLCISVQPCYIVLHHKAFEYIQGEFHFLSTVCLVLADMQLLMILRRLLYEPLVVLFPL